MSENPYNTKKFKDLFKKWNKKLAMAGHVEIEDFDYTAPDRANVIDSNYIPLKRWDGPTFRSMDPDLFAAKQEYFRRAEALLDTYQFDSTFHRNVWILHSKGYSVREISALVKKRSKSPIHNIIKKIQKKTEIKK